MTATETTVETDPNADMEAKLRQAASDADSGMDVDTSTLTSGAQDTERKVEQDSTLDPATETDSAESKDQQEQPAKKKAEPTDTKSDFARKREERERKEQERQDRTWKKLEERREALERREAELQRREQQSPSPRQPARDEPAKLEGYSAKEWEDAAATWEKQGKYDLADMAREKAEQASKLPAQPAAREQASRATDSRPPEETPGTPEFLGTWQRNLKRLGEEHPELTDTTSELYQTTAQLLKSEPWLNQFNDGIAKAVQGAQLVIKANGYDTLVQENAELKEQLAKLQQHTTPSAGGPETRSGNKSFEEMSTAEQEAVIRRRAEEEN